MCMNIGTAKHQPAPFCPRGFPENWRQAIGRARFLRRGAVVPIQLGSHQFPVGYHPLSRRIVGNRAGELYEARRGHCSV